MAEGLQDSIRRRAEQLNDPGRHTRDLAERRGRARGALRFPPPRSHRGLAPVQKARDLREGIKVAAARRSSGRSGVRKAAAATPFEEVQEKHARILGAFREAEGRDPDASDDEFWRAWARVFSDAFPEVMKR